MSSRIFPFDPLELCDNCGSIGAYDFYGDHICGNCLETDMPHSSDCECPACCED